MESTINQKSEIAFDLEITLSPEEFGQHENRVYRDAQKRIVLNGYRKGHVPLPIIRKLHGKSLEQDVLDAAVQDTFGGIAREQGLRPIGQPLVTHIHRTEPGGLHFTISYEVFPAVELTDYKGLPARRITHQVTEDEVDAEIESARERFGKMEEAEQVIDDLCGVTIDLQKMIDGQPEIGAVTKDVNVYLRNPTVNTELKAALLNCKIGDTFRIDLPTGDEGSTNAYDVTVTKIMRVEPAPLDDELARTALGNPEATLTEFREAVRRGVTAEYERRYNSIFRDDLMHAIIERHPFTVPQVLIDEVLQHYLQEYREGPEKELPKGFDIEKFVTEMKPRAEMLARWALLRDLIVEKEGLDAADDDYEGLAAIEADRTGIEFGRILQYMKRTPSYADKIRAEKAIQFLEDYAIVQEIDDRAVPGLEKEAPAFDPTAGVIGEDPVEPEGAR